MDEQTDTTAADTATAAADTATAAADTTATPPVTDGEGEPKPYLGEAKPAPTDDNKEASKATPATEADYLAKVVKDEQLLGTDKNVQIDADLVKRMVPAAQELGVSPETMGKLANALAKAQLEAGREAMRDRINYFNQMKEESVKRYSPDDFAQINAGIDHWFRPNGVMNNVIRSSELGADPEFLALMHYLGSKRVMDSLKGTVDGGSGEAATDPNSTDGLSKIW